VFLADRRWRSGPVSAWRRPVPFGPFLAIGALEYIVFGERLLPAYVAALS
jgi:prepilin signal peptidase PulO-like enzyme (type II secretory pathway)